MVRPPHRLAQHVGEIDHAHLRARHAGNIEQRRATCPTGIRHFDFDLAVVQLALAQLLAEGLARRLARGIAHQRIEHALFGGKLGLGGDFLAQAVAGQGHGVVQQIARDGIHIAADITDLGELGCLHP